MLLNSRCQHCGATRNAYVWHGERMIRARTVTSLTRIIERRGDEGTQLRLFE